MAQRTHLYFIFVFTKGKEDRCQRKKRWVDLH
nr:MAG TPA: hypothetical protein [Caudoviricetes sp.]